MSLETTLANYEAREAESNWRWHKQGCPRCSTAQRARRPQQMCPTGMGYYEARRQSVVELKKQCELDKMPIPGQEMLEDINEALAACEIAMHDPRKDPAT